MHSRCIVLCHNLRSVVGDGSQTAQINFWFTKSSSLLYVTNNVCSNLQITSIPCQFLNWVLHSNPSSADSNSSPCLAGSSVTKRSTAIADAASSATHTTDRVQWTTNNFFWYCMRSTLLSYTAVCPVTDAACRYNHSLVHLPKRGPPNTSVKWRLVKRTTLLSNTRGNHRPAATLSWENQPFEELNRNAKTIYS